MRPADLIAFLVFCAALYFASAAPSTTPGYVPSTTPTASNEISRSANITATQSNSTMLEIVSDLAEHHSNGPAASARFLAETGDSDLSDNEAYYLGVILLVNAFVFFGVVFYLLTPWSRACSWFGNCKHNAAGHGYYPTGLAGHSLDDAAAARTMDGGTFNAPTFLYDRHVSKRSLEYVVPMLKTIAEAYDKYSYDETSASTKEE